jgi:hypothetical protein
VSSKPGRPVLQPPELGSSSSLPRASRPGPDDPRFLVAEALERPEALREAVATGRVRAINADTADGIFGREAGADAAMPRRTAPEVALSTKVPDYVLKQLRLRYAENGTTIRNQILLALRLAGIEVNDRDVTDERKRPRRS